jgi:hypothetical protein
MTVMTALRTARTFVSIAVVSVAASAVLGAGGTASATADHHPAVARATKEWKGGTKAVLATKEWKTSTATVKPLTKEW